MQDDAPELCPCGRPLHYPDAEAQKYVETIIKCFGPNIKVRIEGKPGAYMVPRHWIALHGLIAWKLEELAKDYGWEYIPEPEVKLPWKPR